MSVVEFKAATPPTTPRRDPDDAMALPEEPKDLESLTLVEIAQLLERVTAQIEAERARERDARAHYQALATQTDARIRQIKQQASALVREQQRRLRSFDGMLDQPSDARSDQPDARPRPTQARRHSPLATPANIGQAILRLWTLPEFDQPLTTDQIAEALPTVGYESKAAPRSMRSAVNQALAKLCRDGQIDKYRADGSIIGHSDRRSRARRYMPRP